MRKKHINCINYKTKGPRELYDQQINSTDIYVRRICPPIVKLLLYTLYVYIFTDVHLIHKAIPIYNIIQFTNYLIEKYILNYRILFINILLY